jgi:hypothetical protein
LKISQNLAGTSAAACRAEFWPPGPRFATMRLEIFGESLRRDMTISEPASALTEFTGGLSPNHQKEKEWLRPSKGYHNPDAGRQSGARVDVRDPRPMSFGLIQVMRAGEPSRMTETGYHNPRGKQ